MFKRIKESFVLICVISTVAFLFIMVYRAGFICVLENSCSGLFVCDLQGYILCLYSVLLNNISCYSSYDSSLLSFHEVGNFAARLYISERF